MDSHQKAREKGDDHAMKNVKTEQSLVAHFIRAQHKESDVVSDQRRITHDRCPDRNAPEGKLIPRQKVSGITESKRKDEKTNTHDPVEFPGRPVRTRVEDSHHVQENGYHHSVGCPAVEVPQNLAIVNECKGLHVEICPFNGGGIVKHQQDSRRSQKQEE